MRLRIRAVAPIAALALALTPTGSWAGSDPATDADPVGEPAPAATEPEPYGICFDGECSIPAVTREDLELVGDEDVIYTDDEDPPAAVVCFEGQTTCLLKTGGLTLEDLQVASGGRVVHGAVDADPTGGWSVDNLRSTMECRHPRARMTDLRVPRSAGEGIIERREHGRLLAIGLGEDEASMVVARLGPGVYASVLRLEEDGTTMTIHAFLGMTSMDEMLGTLVVEATSRVQGAQVRCTMNRNVDLVRTSGPTDPDAPEEMDFTEGEVADPDPDAPEEMDFTEDEVAEDGE